MRRAPLRGVLSQMDGLLGCGATGYRSDEELLGQFVARRDSSAEAAFAALVERHGPMVLGVCRRILGNRHSAEDAFQAAFLVLARKAASIARPEMLANWLFGVACRTALDARARATRQFRREQRAQVMSRSQIELVTEDRPVLDELRAILDEEMARLPEHYRVALVLCELEGLTRGAAAERLGISEGTISSRLARAKELLRRHLVQRGFSAPALALHRTMLREAHARAFIVHHSLVQSTMQAAMRVGEGSALAAAASSSVATLARGVLKAMLLAKLKTIVVGVVTLAVVTTGVGVLAQAPAPVAATGTNRDLNTLVAVARSPSIITMQQLVLPGSTALDPARLARIRAPFAPARVVELGKVRDYSRKSDQTEYRELRPGDSVSKGDLLGAFYSVDVGSKKNDLLQALVQLELDQAILDRAEKNRKAIPEVMYLTYVRSVQGDRTEINRALNNLKLWDIPQEEIDALRAEAKKISADKDAWSKTPEGRWVQRAKQGDDANDLAVANDLAFANKQTENPLGRVTLRAPFDGIIVERNINRGEMVVDSTANLLQIADVSRMLVVASCPENSLPLLEGLSTNQRRWTVRAAGAGSGTGLTGTIDEIGYVIDPNQHTAVIKGHVDNPGKLIRGGQYVTATVNIPLPDDVVEIPSDALVDDGEQSVVLVQLDQARDLFIKRRVQVVHRVDGKVFVRKTPIPREEQLTAAEARLGLLPKEPLRVGERVLLRVASGSVGNRLGTLEHKLDQVLEALGALRRHTETKPDASERNLSR